MATDTWNATYEGEPAGSDAASTLDTHIQDLKENIRKRLEDIIGNWSSDPSGVVHYIGIGNAQPIKWKDAGGTWRKIFEVDGTDDLNIYNADEELCLTVADDQSATFASDVTINGVLTDKNGNEVIAMQLETKTTTKSVSTADTSNSVDVTGFSWTPDAVLNVSVGYSSDSYCDVFGLGPAFAASSGATPSGHIEDISFTSGTVTIDFYANLLGTYHIIVTAAKTS